MYFSGPPTSEEQLKALQEAFKTDGALKEKLKAATDPDAVLTIAKPASITPKRPSISL
ncbi:Nif11-like leader peptide family RiPP precursor [Synechococcus sp. NOUM97013]|uniref:Nif11-like leader peptide family RiPP precursor n=1 Tax=Synechococcus sp. NOUM97013 TaxID=1442555 RepID=UPI0016456831|nr:nif11-like leader peptide domain protein [Synechococcus sp. NOUM97013]